MKGVRITKIVKEIKFEGVSGELESKGGFKRQSVTKYLKLTLVFMGMAHYGRGFIAIFWTIFASIDKIFVFGARLVTGLSFYAA